MKFHSLSCSSLTVITTLTKMKIEFDKFLLIVLLSKFTITCSDGGIAESTTGNSISINGNNNSNTENFGVNSHNNETTTENSSSNNINIVDSNKDDATTVNSISSSNNSNIVNSDNNEMTTENSSGISSSNTNITNNSENDKVVICYFKNWGLYKRGLAKYIPANVNTSLCTHIYYAFASLDNVTLTMKFSDKNADIYKGFYKKITALADEGIKVILTLGGWSDSKGDKYSRLVNNSTARANFVNHSIEFLTKYNFQGLDIDWEYPVCWQGKCSAGPPSDKENFGNLIKELSEAYKPLGLHLSAAVAPGPWLIKKGYDVPVFGKYLDYIGLMTYDAHSYRDGYTGANSPFSGVYGVVQSLLNWEKAGAPRTKLVAGFPTYARTYQLKNPEEHGMRAPTLGPGIAANYTRAKGSLAYYEMCSNIRFGNWTSVQSEDNGSYAYLDDQWGSYISVEDIRQRVEYLKTNGYAGALVWSLDMDDFHNMCGCGANPLITAINSIRSTNVEIPDCP